MREGIGMKYAVFDIFADLAHFKKPFTTMSPQTYSFPTGTAAVGILAAILGLDKDAYWQYFATESHSLAIGIIKPIKKVVIPLNLLKTTQTKHFSRFESRKPSNVEFLKDAGFRFYVHLKEPSLFQQLIELLQRHETVYTVSLGLAYNLADIQYRGLYEEQPLTTEDWLEVASVVPTHELRELDFSERQIFSHRIPVLMKPQRKSREVLAYREYLFENEAKKIKARVKHCLRLENDEYILPL